MFSKKFAIWLLVIFVLTGVFQFTSMGHDIELSITLGIGYIGGAYVRWSSHWKPWRNEMTSERCDKFDFKEQNSALEALLTRLTNRENCVICGQFGASKYTNTIDGIKHRRSNCDEVICELERAQLEAALSATTSDSHVVPEPVRVCQQPMTASVYGDRICGVPENAHVDVHGNSMAHEFEPATPEASDDHGN